MTKEPLRSYWRTAQSIYEQLSGIGVPDNLPQLPTELWNDVCRTSLRLAQTLTRHWRAASQFVLTDLDYFAQRLERELQSYRQRLSQGLSSGQRASPREIALDLVALAGVPRSLDR